MRKLIVLSFITLDGVMQGPGGPGEDDSGGFKYGRWTVPYFDDVLGNVMGEQMGHPFDLLLGRTTYDIFAGYWPRRGDDDPAARVINRAGKYVVTHRPGDHDWKTTLPVHGGVGGKIKQLKKGDGPEIQAHGNGNVVQTLLENELGGE